jgi:hypothetical protein
MWGGGEVVEGWGWSGIGVMMGLFELRWLVGKGFLVRDIVFEISGLDCRFEVGVLVDCCGFGGISSLIFKGFKR